VRTHAIVAASAALFLVAVTLRAQQAPPANLVPVTAASLAAQPERYVGKVVAVHASVETVVSATAFSVDQDPRRATLTDVLVIAPNLQRHAEPGDYVTVIGEVMWFTTDAVKARAGGYTLDLSPDAVTRFQGRPMVLASSVVTSTMTELAQFVPPPSTPEEEAFDAVMKQVNPTLGDLRKGLEAGDAAIVAEQGKKLRDLFGETRAFFAKRATADAEGWAGTAVTLVDTVTRGAAAGDWTAAREAASQIQPLCATCHNAHRERLEDGSYRVRRTPGQSPQQD
jgi:cytochrome c556